MITPRQAWDWHVFKSECGPTYAGSTGWKRYTDFLVSKMQEFSAVDLGYIEIPYDDLASEIELQDFEGAQSFKHAVERQRRFRTE